MQMKWLAFWLIVVGCVAFFHAMRRANRAVDEYESGEFIWLLLESFGGLIAIIAGIGTALYLLMFE
jgi:hypothetical protein